MINEDVRHIIEPNVKSVYDSFPEKASKQLLVIRGLIFKVADASDKIGTVQETLKWGEPSYLTQKPKSGTTIRLGWKKKQPNSISLFVNCRTSLIEEWQHIYGEKLNFIGHRELRLPIDSYLPIDVLSNCIHMALTYHVRKTP